MPEAAYDKIGRGYAEIRRADPRIAARIEAALADCHTVVNVGAGAGSYEPAVCEVTPVEPSAEMIAQRPGGAAKAVQASAEELPFDDDSFDAAMAVLSVHHFADQSVGLAEMVRVARRRVVIFTIDPDRVREIWMVADYFPPSGEVDRRVLPSIDNLVEALPRARREVVPGPSRCTDGFTLALWDRPELFLDPDVRRASSVWHAMPNEAVDKGLRRLQEDLASGRWDEKYGHLREQDELDIGLRLVISELQRDA